MHVNKFYKHMVSPLCVFLHASLGLLVQLMKIYTIHICEALFLCDILSAVLDY